MHCNIYELQKVHEIKVSHHRLQTKHSKTSKLNTFLTKQLLTLPAIDTSTRPIHLIGSRQGKIDYIPHWGVISFLYTQKQFRYTGQSKVIGLCTCRLLNFEGGAAMFVVLCRRRALEYLNAFVSKCSLVCCIFLVNGCTFNVVWIFFVFSWLCRIFWLASQMTQVKFQSQIIIGLGCEKQSVLMFRLHFK